MEGVRASYRLRIETRDAEARADALALEQSVELPRVALRDPILVKEIVPAIDDLVPDPAGGTRATLVFPAATFAGDPAQLLNVLFGNASLQEDVELLEVSLPEPLARSLGGPRVGIAGLRALVEARGRPLTCVALKPMGLSAAALADLAATFVRAGVDVVKDDHGLADQPHAPFEERLTACLAAVDAEARRRGRPAVYAPSLVGTPEVVHERLRLARERGATAVLVEPMLLGLPLLCEIAREARGMAILAHPGLAGGLRIAPETLLGTLFRAFGADATIFPHAGGRFAFDERTCARLAARLREPHAGLRPALPVPAGGMSVERVAEIVRFYGTDAMLLVGGTLYAAGPALEERTRDFVARVEDAAEELTGGRAAAGEGAQ